MSQGEKLSVVVPTLGTSQLLPDCLEALRKDTEGKARILLVDQGTRPSSLPEGLVDEMLRPERNLGFAGGMNRGFAECRTEYVAAVNDDLVIDAGWTAALLDSLDSHPKAAAAQGINLQLGSPECIDGAGIAFNDWWQAAQRGHGQPLASWTEGPGPVEIFGVSATAAIYRRSALDDVALEVIPPGGTEAEARSSRQVFDESFESYYEDVDLACRLRQASFSSLLVPGARARHAGSVTGKSLGMGRLALIYGNRYAALARFLGSSFDQAHTRARQRDLRDLLGALLRFQPRRARGIFQGIRRGRRMLESYRHEGNGEEALRCLRRFRDPAPLEAP